MSATPRIGQMLKGRLGSYTVTSKLYESVWKGRDSQGGNVVVKSLNHWRLRSERDVLLRYQSPTPYIRPLLDEVDPDMPSHALILRWLDTDLLDATDDKGLESSDIKLVAKGVLKALQVLHADGLILTDLKPSNVLVNYKPGRRRIAEVHLADFGSTFSTDSEHPKKGSLAGTPIFRSPELQLELPWSTSTDNWSFGVMIVDAIYGAGFHLMKPDVPIDHEDYVEGITRRYHRCLGPFPCTYSEIADDQTLIALNWIMRRLRRRPCGLSKEQLRGRFPTPTETSLCDV